MKGIRVLLSRTEGPVNLGFIARAMANTGFSSLSYSGEIEKDHEEALRYAVHASDILGNALHAPDFETLIGGSDIIVGFSPRDPYSNSTLDFSDLSSYVTECLDRGLSVGLLFGNEKSGLDNAELSVCAKRVSLPTSSEYTSMNLAQAVLVSLWELKNTRSDKNTATDYADRQTLDILLKRLREYLELIEFFNDQNPDLIWQELRQTLESKELTSREAELLISVVGKSISRYTHLIKKL